MKTKYPYKSWPAINCESECTSCGSQYGERALSALDAPLREPVAGE